MSSEPTYVIVRTLERYRIEKRPEGYYAVQVVNGERPLDACRVGPTDTPEHAVRLGVIYGLEKSHD